MNEDKLSENNSNGSDLNNKFENKIVQWYQ